MPDQSHLNALRFGLSNERVRLANAKTEGERKLRAVWVAQREREIEGELRRLGVEDDAAVEMTDDELLAALA